MVTVAPSNISESSKRGIASISLLFSKHATWPTERERAVVDPSSKQVDQAFAAIPVVRTADGFPGDGDVISGERAKPLGQHLDKFGLPYHHEHVAIDIVLGSPHLIRQELAEPFKAVFGERRHAGQVITPAEYAQKNIGQHMVYLAVLAVVVEQGELITEGIEGYFVFFRER